MKTSLRAAACLPAWRTRLSLLIKGFWDSPNGWHNCVLHLIAASATGLQSSCHAKPSTRVDFFPMQRHAHERILRSFKTFRYCDRGSSPAQFAAVHNLLNPGMFWMHLLLLWGSHRYQDLVPNSNLHVRQDFRWENTLHFWNIAPL